MEVTALSKSIQGINIILLLFSTKNIMVFNTGETSDELKAKYNPEGSLLRRVQLRMLDMLMTQCAKSSTSATALMEEHF